MRWRTPRVARDVDAGDLCPPAARPQQAAQHADDGRLARPVGTDKAHDLAAAPRNSRDRPRRNRRSAWSDCRRRSRISLAARRSCAPPPGFEERDEQVLDSRGDALDPVEGHARCRSAPREFGRAARRHRRRRPARCRPAGSRCTPARPATTSRGSRAPSSRRWRGSRPACALEGGRRVAIEQRPSWRSAEPIAALGLVEIGGGDDDGDAFLAQVVEDAPEVAARDRIDAGGRLVEQQHLRRVDQRAGEARVSASCRRTTARPGGRESASCRRLPAGAPRAPRRLAAARRTYRHRTGCFRRRSGPHRGRTAAACS